MKEIRIRLQDVTPEGLIIRDVFPRADIGVTPQDIIRIDGDVSIDAKATITDKILLVDARIDGVCSSECSRCLKDVSRPFHQDTWLDFDLKEAKDSIDIAEDVRQEIVAALPMLLLCREDCRGLCPVCGVNLNEKQCEHIRNQE